MKGNNNNNNNNKRRLEQNKQENVKKKIEKGGFCVKSLARICHEANMSRGLF